MKVGAMQYRVLLLIFLTVITCAGIQARKTGFKFKNTTSESVRNKGVNVSVVEGRMIEPQDTVGDMVEGSFMVASQCEKCNNGYRLDQIVFSGFDKVLKSNKESFYIKNLTDRTLTSIVLYIDYRMPDGRQLTKRFLKLSCRIPAGETRKADIPTFDTQNSYYYNKSMPPKRGGNAFEVFFDPIAYYLQF